MSTLLLGAGNSRQQRLSPFGDPWPEPVITLDIDVRTKPDIWWDLNKLPLPRHSNTFDEIHAYEVLEHLGTQGDYSSFFALFTELHRITKPGGLLCALVPTWNSLWAWGDPGHTRIINQGTLTFLSQTEYEKQVGNTPMTDYRSIYKVDWELVMAEEIDDTFAFVLKAIKE